MRKDRTLVLCFDGTSNEFDETNTNVIKLCAAIRMQDRNEQMVYYQPGIGTWTPPGINGRIRRFFSKAADLAVAWFLPEHVMNGYEFLMDNHLPGDKICIFGFSRGAYTARALAGMLHYVGLLPKGNHEQVSFAYSMYKKNSNLAEKFKTTFCKSVDIEFLGVWDTVASVGFIIPKKLPYISNDTVKRFRHAISLDEHRMKFGVTLWNLTEEVAHRNVVAESHTTEATNTTKEMWFAGTHGDVGGGYVRDGTTPRDLSNIAFRWMLSEVHQIGCIHWDDNGLDYLKVPYDCIPRGEDHPKPTNTEAASKVASDATTISESERILPWKEADRLDALASHHDMLHLNRWWYLFQLPTWTENGMNWTGRRSFSKGQSSHIHWTVMDRVNGKERYVPRAFLPPEWKTLVVKSED